MKKTVVLTIGILLVFALGVLAADISGKWTAQIPGRNGQARETTFTFKVSGDTVTGSMSGRQNDTPIAEGKLSGDTLTFSISRDRGGETVKQTYTGKISGNEIKFKREGGQGPATEFTAKRAQ
jgi:hypothetical protein